MPVKENAISAGLLRNSDGLMAVGVVGMIIMLIIPIPAFILDLSISFNITLAMVTILVVMYTIKAVDFSVYPSLLLVTTVFRLAINVSSTRLILLQGTQFEGKIIRAFGEFVIGGNYVVGIVIFLVLVIIQYMVVVKGAKRVSEVTARFTLDAMPGKQMAIDADLNAGLLTEREAVERRAEIRKEADFYGAMDGAANFVQGDVIAGLIITAINIVGGFAIGVGMRGESLGDAASTYTILTIGDGLVSQIPSLLISISMGLIVTRAASEDNLGMDFVSQLTQQPRALYITSGVLASLGIFTPLPFIPLVALAGVSGFLGHQMSQTTKDLAQEAENNLKEETEKARKPENVVSLLQVDPMELEIGYALIPLVDPEQGGDLLDRITMIRRQMALEMGLIVPPIRIRDNMQLRPNQYVLKIKGVEVAGGNIRVDQYLAMNPGTATEEVEGEATTEPAFGLPALWIREDKRGSAEMAGYTVVDPPSVVATHITEIIKRHAPEILGRQETQTIIDHVKGTYPALVEEATKVMTIGEIHKVLQGLLGEGVSIRDMVTVLETLADRGGNIKDVDRLVEICRTALARHICKQYMTEDGVLNVITIDPRLEEEIVSSVVETPDGRQVSLDPKRMQGVLQSLSAEVEKVMNRGLTPVVLASPRLRPLFKQLTGRAAPGLVILSYNEIVTDVEIQNVGMVSSL